MSLLKTAIPGELALPANLHDWFMANRARDEMTYKGAAEAQIIFVRDELPRVFFHTYKESEKNPWRVISTHTSKSIKLPVYQLEIPRLKVTMRGNFHNWIVSIETPFTGVERHFRQFFELDHTVDSCYAEGFPKELVYPSFTHAMLNHPAEGTTPLKFTVEVSSSEYQLYTLLFLLAAKARHL